MSHHNISNSNQNPIEANAEGFEKGCKEEVKLNDRMELKNMKIFKGRRVKLDDIGRSNDNNNSNE